ncbi:hypothetical protein A3A36_02750 [Candidatus Kaiserbacteria bacterium RIFCSPLOWO2_01_FULL_52_12b]|uniref:Uncharacterized protein n=1 Tax=Candidatus Kaiserbacteria bacterium RIFCSPLOWO2_01_FULL_52_12b TaxID=1798509 RepID=A0A1F6EWQ9_9BACT|nr:MAG: hypothetical protein A3A36_02750 [Candidatus Kaiserbacteria bacterium RIFCSPLOWO2_01_FULL_52_12b]
MGFFLEPEQAPVAALYGTVAALAVRASRSNFPLCFLAKNDFPVQRFLVRRRPINGSRLRTSPLVSLHQGRKDMPLWYRKKSPVSRSLGTVLNAECLAY